jgi:hypothetical protein
MKKLLTKTNLMILGGVLVVSYFLFRKKKPTASISSSARPSVEDESSSNASGRSMVNEIVKPDTDNIGTTKFKLLKSHIATDKRGNKFVFPKRSIYSGTPTRNGYLVKSYTWANNTNFPANGNVNGTPVYNYELIVPIKATTTDLNKFIP